MQWDFLLAKLLGKSLLVLTQGLNNPQLTSQHPAPDEVVADLVIALCAVLRPR